MFISVGMSTQILVIFKDHPLSLCHIIGLDFVIKNQQMKQQTPTVYKVKRTVYASLKAHGEARSLLMYLRLLDDH